MIDEGGIADMVGSGAVAKRVIHFANIPIKLLMPSSFRNINEIALKTIPSASKIEIKRVLESMYGFEVRDVRTINMEGKKKKRGGALFAKPDYKKAYVTLRNSLSISPDIFPISLIEEEKRKAMENRKRIVVDKSPPKSHWLDRNSDSRFKPEKLLGNKRTGSRRRGGSEVKFPWSSMKSYR